MKSLLITRLLLWMCFFSFVLHNSVFFGVIAPCGETHFIAESSEVPDSMDSHVDEEDIAFLNSTTPSILIGSTLRAGGAHFTHSSHIPGPLLPPPKSQ